MAQFRFVTSEGADANDNDAVFPILRNLQGRWAPVGTGFFISTNGVFLTAWHVLAEALDANGGMNCDGIAAFHFLSGNQYIIRPVLRCCHHNKSDIAVGVLAEARHNITKELLTNSVMRLTTTQQEQGDLIVTWAYPRSSAVFEKGIQKVRFSPNFFSGKLEEYFPVLRDRALMPFPCYRGNIELLGGASGGPVASLSSGKVFAVNCTGIDGKADKVSHYACLSVLQDLWLDNVNIDGVFRERVMLQELIAKGHIDCT